MLATIRGALRRSEVAALCWPAVDLSDGDDDVVVTVHRSKTDPRPVSIRSRSARVSAGVSTGVAPFVTTCFGPRTAAAGFTGSTWWTTSQSQERPDRGQVLLHRRRRPGMRVRM